MSQNLPPTVDFSITQHFPVADHVYKYLIKCCGGNHMIASRTTAIGNQVLSLQGRNYDVKPSNRKFRKIFSVTIPEHYYSKTGMYIDSINAQLFNDQVDRFFREELYRHMLMTNHTEKKHFMKSLRKFLEFYEIGEDDIKLDTLHRDFKRKKKDLEENLNLTSTPGTNFETSNNVPKKSAAV